MIRGCVLGGILAAVVAAYAYDRFVAAPGSERAYEAVQDLVEERNGQAAGTTPRLASADVQAAVGFAPTFTQVEQDYTIEWYCWWGWVPGLNTWKRFVTVVYVGNEPRRVGSHYINEVPPQESLPKHYLPKGIAQPLPTPGPLGMSGPAGDRKQAPSESRGTPDSNEESNASPEPNAPAKRPGSDGG
jgi:hypothetical protein